MTDFYTRKRVPTWRLVIYSILAASGVAALGVYQNDKRLYIAAPICGVFIAAVGFGLSRLRANATPISGLATEKTNMPWSTQFFIGAAAFTLITTLEIITGQRWSKYHPHSIDRVQHLTWYLVPVGFCLVGFAFRIYENRKKN